MVQPEKHVLWHPRKKNKFIVGENSQIILYEWASEHPEIRHVTSQHDLQYTKCFAWSPDPAFDDLIAVGFNNGKVDLIRLEASKQSQRKNVLSSGPSVTLPVRNTRACNALAFNNVDPNYLAVGLDKLRGDSSLIIWDISTLLPSLRLPSIGPLDVLAVNNLSVPHSRPQPPIPRVENHGRIDSRIVQQHVPTETISSLTFLPSSMHILLASISNRYLRLFDLRAPSIPAMNVGTKISGIAADPLDSHRIASFGGEAVTIWDVRKIMHPLLIFSERDALADGALSKPGVSYSKIEFSGTRRGTIATLEKDSTHVRFWDLAESRVSLLDGGTVGGGGSSDDETNKSSRDSNRASKKSWAAIPWPSGGEKEQHLSKEKDLSSSMELPSTQQSFVLADTRRTKYFPRPLASFALVPNANPNAPHPITSNLIVVNVDGDLELYAIHDTPKQTVWSAKGDLALGAGLGLKVLEGFNDRENDEDEGNYISDGMDQRERSVSNRYRNESSRGSAGSRGRASERDRISCSPPQQRPMSSTGTRGRPDFIGFDPHATHIISPLSVLPPAPDRPTTAVEKPSTLFGFGDESDLPLLPTPPTSSAAPTITSLVHVGLAATQQKKFGQSPARVKNYSQFIGTGKERKAENSGRWRSLSRTDTLPADDLDDSNEYNVGFTTRSRSLNKSGRPSDVPNSQSRDARGKERSRKTKATSVARLVKEDISMIMRKRVKAGYGLSQPQHNVLVTQIREPAKGASQALPEIWAWLHHSQETLCLPTPRFHGYDFSYQGLLSIWEGFSPVPISHQTQFVEETTMQRSILLETGTQPKHIHAHSASTGSTASTATSTATAYSGISSVIGQRSRSPVDELQGNWSAALAVLAARRGTDRATWKPTVSTSKLLQRRIALQLAGWSLREDELAAAIKRWQKEGQFARAACWLVFMKQYSKAVELLMRSDDETHQMMSGTIAALGPLMSASGSARGLELRELYGRLTIKINDPYFRMLLTHLSTNEWSEVLDEEVIPFRERLAIAFQFLDDRTLTSYLHRMTEQACEHGFIEALMVTGLTPAGMRIIQSYLDHTGDVQTAAILSSYVCPHRFKYKGAERWLEAYRDLLDGFKLHYLRVGFDIERGQILHEATQGGDFQAVEEWAPRQILISCHYCHKQVNNPGPAGFLQNDQPSNGKPTQCVNCARELPRCSVCLMTLSIISDATREAVLGCTQNRDTFDDAIVICQTCRHGGHAAHILEWFFGEDSHRTHHVCPVADCSCRCADEF